MTPESLAAQRTAAVQRLQDQLAGHVQDAERSLYEGLLARLSDIHADPALLPALLQEYTNTVLVPLASFYGQAMLHLPSLSLEYFKGLDITGYQKLRAPLASFLQARLGIDSAGAIVPGGYLSQVAGDTTVARQVLTYAYKAQASGVGLTGYRDGLNALVLGGDVAGTGLVNQLYRESGDTFSQTDRALQAIGGNKLGLTAAIYQGGLIDSSRPFCIARNGKVFLDSEVAKFGTKEDTYGGYTNKEEGLFSGKPEPYTPQTDAGGYNCRHSYHYISNLIALRMRPDLKENEQGNLVPA